LNSLIKEILYIIEKYNIKKENLFILIEPNSFHLDEISSKYDYREKQLLLNESSEKLSFQKTSQIYETYDSIYRNAFIDYGFKIIKKPIITDKRVFYDSVHFTEFGSKFLGLYISNIFRKLN